MGNSDFANRHRTEDGWNATPVVEISVADDHDVQPLDTERCECWHDYALPPVATREGTPGVDQYRRVVALDQTRSTLSHLERDEARPGGHDRSRRRRDDYIRDNLNFRDMYPLYGTPLRFFQVICIR